MISAGSEVPNFSDACDLAGTRETSLWRCRPAASVALVLLSCLLFQGCKTSETKGTAEPESAAPRLAAGKGETVVPRGARSANANAPRDTFADRFFQDSFAERYAALGIEPQTAREVVFAPQSGNAMAFAPASARETAGDRPVRIPSTAYKVAALSPVLPNLSAVKQANTRLIGFDNSAFPYGGKSPRGTPGSRHGDNRVLVHVPPGFDARKPGVIVVFFHGHGATLERDVRDRQLLPRQITEFGRQRRAGGPAACLRCRRFQRRQVLGARWV